MNKPAPHLLNSASKLQNLKTPQLENFFQNLQKYPKLCALLPLRHEDVSNPTNLPRIPQNRASFWGGKLRFATHAAELFPQLDARTCPASFKIAPANSTTRKLHESLKAGMLHEVHKAYETRDHSKPGKGFMNSLDGSLKVIQSFSYPTPAAYSLLHTYQVSIKRLL